MKVVNERGDDWDDHIEQVLFGYRVSTQASTKMSPFEVLYGVKPTLPIDLQNADDCDTSDDVTSALATRVQTFAESLVTLRQKAKDNTATAQAKQKKTYDLKHAPPMYKVGDKVLK